MNRFLKKCNFVSGKRIILSGSKSESNRLLILQRLYPNITIKGLSQADDTTVLQNALHSSLSTIDVRHAGTAMRFLTAYFSIMQGKEVILKGSERMHNRPIGELVEALREIGADIEYLQEEGFPPLKIKGKTLEGGQINIRADISSQFLSALLLIGGKLPKGLHINFTTPCTSLPYLEMTTSILNEVGISCKLTSKYVKIFPTPNVPSKQITVEGDWSSASYLYSMVALSEMGSELELQPLYSSSKQGDAIVASIFEKLGVKTTFTAKGCKLKRIPIEISYFSYNFTNCPDLAQTLATTCFGLAIPCFLEGLHTLKVKETNRIEALEKELAKLGANVQTKENHLKITPKPPKNNKNILTYDDHRMALSFAPLSLITNIEITDSEVVSKSYPLFWNDYKTLTTQKTEN